MAVSDLRPAAEPVAWAAAVTAVVALAAFVFGWTADLTALVIAAVNSVLAIVVRANVTAPK